MSASVFDRWQEHLSVRSIHHFFHQRLVWVLLGTYFLAGIAPHFGLLLRATKVGTLRTGGATMELTVPAVLLGLLVFNASLGIDTRQMRALAKHPLTLVAGILANSVIPLTFTFLASMVLSLWHDPAEMQSLLVGLAIVGAMPIAGSSTAWAQGASGNLALSLGMVLCSTLLSPIVTPMAFHAVSHLTTGDYSEDLRGLAGADTQLFLLAGVVVPSALGIASRLLFKGRVQSWLPHVKLVTLVALLLLNYANAAVALPRIVKYPEWGFLALVVVIMASRCLLSFTSGWWVGRVAGGGPSERVSLMFSLGMNNNGSGLVLASAQLAHYPNVLFAIVAYNLVQQLVAGAADTWLVRTGVSKDS